MNKYHLLVAFVCLLVGCATADKKSTSPKEIASSPPKLLKPEVRKIWIPPEIKNGGQEWVEGHFMYRIEKETTWSR